MWEVGIDVKAEYRNGGMGSKLVKKLTIEILKYFNLYQHFDFVGGASMDEKRAKKADVIAYVLEKNNVVDLAAVVMIGDREHDIYGAKQIGIDSVGGCMYIKIMRSWNKQEQLT